MLRLQAPLPDRYTLAAPDELDDWIARRQGRAGRPAPDPRPPLPARRSHQVGRRPRRLVQARPLRGGQRPGHRHRVLRRALHGRVGRRAHRRRTSGSSSPTSTPAARWPTWPTSTRSRSAGRRSATVTDIDRVVPDHLHELLGGAEGVRRRARRRGLHVVERPGRSSSGRSPRRPGDEGAVLPRPAPRAQHRATTWATTSRRCGCGTRASSSAASRSATSRRRRSCSGRATARCTSASGPSTSPQFRAEYPDGEVIVHPECAHDVVELADQVGSTERILDVGRARAAPGSVHRRRHRDPHGAAHGRASIPTSRSCRSTR